MIKKLLVALLLALPFSTFAQVKFAVVNTQELVTDLPAYKKLMSDLEAQQKKLNEEGQKLQSELQAKAEEFDKLDPSTPETIKQRRQEELQKLYQNIQQFMQQSDQDLQRAQQAGMQPIYQSVMEAIQRIGKDGGYTMVFENTMPLYLDPAQVTDITAKVKAAIK